MAHWLLHGQHDRWPDGYDDGWFFVVSAVLRALGQEVMLSILVCAVFIMEVGVLVMVVEMSLLRPMESSVLSVLERNLLSVLWRMPFSL